MYLFGLRGIAVNLNRAAEHFQQAIDIGNDAMAANYLARMFWNGNPMKKNLTKALQLLHFAAEKNISLAQNNLAYMSYKGIGMKKNLSNAMKYFMKAANEHNYSQSMYYIGKIFKNGEIADEYGYKIKTNISKSIEYFRRASDLLHYRSVYELAQFYRKGKGVKRNCRKALELLKFVAEYHSVKYEQENARRAFENGQYSEAYLLYAKSAEIGYLNAQINSAYLVRHGYHQYLYDMIDNIFYHQLFFNSPLISETPEILLKDTDCSDSYYSNINICNKESHHHSSYKINHEQQISPLTAANVQVFIPNKKQLAFHYYSLAAAQNHSRSLRWIGDYHWYSWMQNSIGFEIFNFNESEMDLKDNKMLACMLYELASEQSVIDPNALYNLAYCYEFGDGKEKNISKSRNLYWTAAISSVDSYLPCILTMMRMEFKNILHAIL